MGWTCQHDYQGYCKLVKKSCSPGMKGCTLKGDFVFSENVHANDEKKENEDEEKKIDFAALVRSN